MAEPAKATHAYQNINRGEGAPKGVCAFIVDQERRLCMRLEDEHLTGLALAIAQKSAKFDAVLSVVDEDRLTRRNVDRLDDWRFR